MGRVSSAFFSSSPIASSPCSQRLVLRRRPVEELLLEGLHPAKGLGAIEPRARDVVDQPVELVDRRLGLVARVLLRRLDLLEEIFDVVEIVRSHVDRIDRLRVRDRRVRMHLEERHADEGGGEPDGDRAIARPPDRDGEPGTDVRRERHRVLDGSIHERRARRGLCERQGIGEAVVEGVEPIEAARACALGQPPDPRDDRGREDSEARDPEHHEGGAAGQGPHLARGDGSHRDDQGRTERLRTHTEGAIEADASLRVEREPTNLLDSVLLAGHPLC